MRSRKNRIYKSLRRGRKSLRQGRKSLRRSRNSLRSSRKLYYLKGGVKAKQHTKKADGKEYKKRLSHIMKNKRLAKDGVTVVSTHANRYNGRFAHIARARKTQLRSPLKGVLKIPYPSKATQNAFDKRLKGYKRILLKSNNGSSRFTWSSDGR